MPKLIETWEEVLENFQNFNSSIKIEDSIAIERLNRFFHWYYLPTTGLFAPSKFIGYKNMTLFNYKGEGTGTRTQQVLSRFFNKIDKKTETFKQLYSDLDSFLREFDKRISEKTLRGSGGIYTPKEKYKEEIFINQDILNQVTKDLDSLRHEEDQKYSEGNKKERYVITYERNPTLRSKAIQIHGYTCQACGFNFLECYGEHGKSFIEIHHKTPLSKLKEEINIDPQKDMASLCSNCHRMIHRDKNNILTIEELKKIISVAHNSR
jgi:predicted HNH restriction endonuclease